MISAYTGTHIREVEKQLLEASADTGMGAVLMQRAAYGLANTVIRELRDRGLRAYGSSVTVLAGKGTTAATASTPRRYWPAAASGRRRCSLPGRPTRPGCRRSRAAGGRDTVLTESNAADLAAAAAGPTSCLTLSSEPVP